MQKKKSLPPFVTGFFFSDSFNKLRGRYFHTRKQGRGEISMGKGKEFIKGIRVAWLSHGVSGSGLAELAVHIILLSKEQNVWF